MSTTVTYNVAILGRLWMPQCAAAIDNTYRRDDYPFTSFSERVWWNNRAAELEAVEDQATTDAGDLSCIEDMEIIRTVTVVRPDGAGGMVRQSNSVTLRAWRDEESECEYHDCFAEPD